MRIPVTVHICQSVCQAMHPFEKDCRTFMQRHADELHRSAVIDEGAEGVFRNKVREHIARVFGSVRSPCTGYVLMAKRLGFADVFQKCLVMFQPCLFIVQRKLAPHEDLIWSLREMHAVPRL
jgi:hypothetical protein